MTPVTPPLALVLAVKPTHRGFGWAAFESPFTPFDWGLAEARLDAEAGALRSFEKLLDRLTPETLLLEAFERGEEATRPVRLSRAMAALAAKRGARVEVYTRGQVQACFAGVGARTRDEIAAAIARQFDAFGHRLPPRRRPWESEDRRMALFAAVALLVTYYKRGADSGSHTLAIDL
jgi:alkylhydroperoxidase/carboxymuconolactone decarboxylase family protein YurZ